MIRQRRLRRWRQNSIERPIGCPDRLMTWFTGRDKKPGHCRQNRAEVIGRRAVLAISSVVLRGQVDAVALKIRRIDCFTRAAGPAIAALAELSPKGNVVSPEGKARTIAAFGEPLSPRQVVELHLRRCRGGWARGRTRLFAPD